MKFRVYVGGVEYLSPAGGLYGHRHLIIFAVCCFIALFTISFIIKIPCSRIKSLIDKTNTARNGRTFHVNFLVFMLVIEGRESITITPINICLDGLSLLNGALMAFIIIADFRFIYFLQYQHYRDEAGRE